MNFIPNNEINKHCLTFVNTNIGLILQRAPTHLRPGPPQIIIIY